MLRREPIRVYGGRATLIISPLQSSLLDSILAFDPDSDVFATGTTGLTGSAGPPTRVLHSPAIGVHLDAGGPMMQAPVMERIRLQLEEARAES